MIDQAHAQPVTRQARELGISRGSVCYLPSPVSASGLAIMRRIDELHMDFSFAGSRTLRDLLGAEGVRVGRLHVAKLMEKMGVEAAQPGVGDRHHLHPDGARVRLSRRHR